MLRLGVLVALGDVDDGLTDGVSDEGPEPEGVGFVVALPVPVEAAAASGLDVILPAMPFTVAYRLIEPAPMSTQRSWSMA